MPKTATRTANLGHVSGTLAEQLAYLNSPAAIDAEIRWHERAIAGGDTSAATRQLLADWRAVRRAQSRLALGEELADD